MYTSYTNFLSKNHTKTHTLDYHWKQYTIWVFLAYYFQCTINWDILILIWNSIQYEYHASKFTAQFVCLWLSMMAERLCWCRSACVRNETRTHAVVLQCGDCASASPLHSSGSGCAASCSRESQSPWKLHVEKAGLTLAGQASLAESCESE